MELVVRGELVEVDGAVVGAARMRWWDEADGTRLYLLTGSVEPAWQGQGIGRQVLAWQEDRAREHAAADATVGTPMFGGNPESERQSALLEAAGYRVAFTRVRMTMPLNSPAAAPTVPEGVELRPASAADHRAVFEANAEVFGGSSLGYIQDTFEEFEADAAEDFPEYALWTLAWDGDRLAGWVVSGVDDTPWSASAPTGADAVWRPHCCVPTTSASGSTAYARRPCGRSWRTRPAASPSTNPSATGSPTGSRGIASPSSRRSSRS